MKALFQGLKAIHSPHTGIVDWGLVTKFYGKQFMKLGGKIFTNFCVTDLKETKESKSGSMEGLKYPVSVIGQVNNYFVANLDLWKD